MLLEIQRQVSTDQPAVLASWTARHLAVQPDDIQH